MYVNIEFGHFNFSNVIFKDVQVFILQQFLVNFKHNCFELCWIFEFAIKFHNKFSVGIHEARWDYRNTHELLDF